MSDSCDAILVSGNRKGEKCGLKVTTGTKCTRHNRKLSYSQFSKKNRPIIKKENPTASFGEISKILGEQWRQYNSE